MNRKHLTFGLGIVALIAAALAPRLLPAARSQADGPLRIVHTVVESPVVESPIAPVEPIGVAEPDLVPAPPTPPTPVVIEPRNPVPPRPPVAVVPPEAPMAPAVPVRPQPLLIPELDAPVAAVPAEPVSPPEPELPPDFWDGCPACGMG